MNIKSLLPMALLVALLASGCGARIVQAPPAQMTVVVPPPVVTVIPPTVIAFESPLAPPESRESESFEVSVDGVTTVTETVVVSFTVSGGRTQSPLFDVPELEGQDPTPASLEAAQFALLRMGTQGSVATSLTFPIPGTPRPWALVFNPGHEPGDVVSPRVEVRVGGE